MDFLANLNSQQQQAVQAGLGPVLVLAGPGSGKTRVLTRRIAYLIGAMGVRPYNILAVTFTNKAAREMEQRVFDLLGAETRGLVLGTFHSVCARLLRREAPSLPFQSNFVIFDADDQVRLVKNALLDLNIDEKKHRAPGVHAAISRAKNELIMPERFPVQTYRDEVVKRVYKRYQEMLLTNNALDFDDLLLWMAKLMEENPQVREKYSRRFEHVLVDEFQDTNMAQYQLIGHLASFHHNVFVVGDTDQAIYRWRGADYRNVLRFEKDFPDTQVILLEQNYRSTQHVLDVAMAVIDRNPQRTRKSLFTERGTGQKVVLHEAYDERVEAAYVVDTIAGLVARQQVRPGDFAIMYRTNAQSRVLEEAFLSASLPYKLVGAQRFYGRREIKDIMAYLRVIHNPHDEISLSRMINTPARGIGEKTYLGLRAEAQRAEMSPGTLLIEVGRGQTQLLESFTGRAASSLVNVGNLLAGWTSLAPGLAPLALMDRVIEDVDFRAYIDDNTEEGHERWENILELRRLAAEYADQPLEAFLERVALVSDQDTMDEQRGNVPTLLTLHAAKGLEFPHVFIIGLDEGTLPHSRSFDDPEAMMEERRLFYVGITRAKDVLYLVHPLNRSAYGFAEPTDPSRFLNDIPSELLSDESSGRSARRPGRHSPDAPAYRPDRWDTPASKTARVTQSRYHPGARVVHPVWGEGMVLNSRIENDDELVDVFFENMGLKRVLASMAKLEIKE